VLLALTVLSGCGGAWTSAKKSPTPAHGSVAFAPLDLGLPRSALAAPVTGKLPNNKVLHVGVTLKVSDAAWKQFGKGKASVQGTQGLAQKLGVSDTELKKINDFLAAAHIKATTSATRTSLTFDVRVGQASQLLQTSFVTHRMNGREYFTPDPAHMPMVPKQVADYVLAVTGLESWSIAPVAHSTIPASARSLGTAATAPGCGQFPPVAVTPRKLEAAYGYDRMWAQGWHGENMTVNLVEIDGYDWQDINNYLVCNGSHASLGNVELGAGALPPGLEATMDIEMVAGLAPSARLVDYETDSALLNTGSGADIWTAINNALQRIIDDNVGGTHPGSMVSVSLGGGEAFVSQAAIRSIDQSIRILTEVEHMTVFVAAGDCGAYGDRIYGPLDVSFPASSPSAVAVGGTVMHFAGDDTRSDEVVWSDRSNLAKCDNQWGSGGGLSKVFARPAYQQAPGASSKYSTGGRQLPDVSAAAFDIPVLFQGKWVPILGTSAATPIWAAGMTLIDQGLIARRHFFFYGPDTFYQVAGQGGPSSPYYDVVQGNNLFYPATPGYDLSTGLGTPNAPNLFDSLLTMLV
jgi:kumamolisin